MKFVALATVVVVLAVAAALILLGRVAPSRPLPRNFAAEYNALSEALPTSDRAWAVYLNASLALRPYPEAIGGSLTEPGCRIADPCWPQLRAYLEAHASGLTTLRRAAAMPRIGCILTDGDDVAYLRVLSQTSDSFGSQPPNPSSVNPWLIDVMLSQSGELRFFVRLLRADARFAAEERNGERFVDDCEAIFGAARHLDESPFLISRLSSFASASAAMDLVMEQLCQGPSLLNDAQLVRLRQCLDSIEFARLDLPMRSLRDSIDDVHQRVYEPSGRPSRSGLRELEKRLNQVAHLGAEGSAVSSSDTLDRAVVANRQEVESIVDEWVAAATADASLHFWERTHASSDAVLSQAQGGTPLRFPTLVAISPIGSALDQRDIARMRRSACITAIELERHRRSHGEFPTLLNELDPALQASTPIDEYTGRLLIYRVSTLGACLYSTGPDGDDDAGRPLVSLPRMRTRVPPDGDLVFLSPPAPAK